MPRQAWFDHKGNQFFLLASIWIIGTVFISESFTKGVALQGSNNMYALMTQIDDGIERTDENKIDDVPENDEAQNTDEHVDIKVPTTTTTKVQFTNYTSKEYMKHRIENFDSWYVGGKTDKLKPNADENGTIIDFAIAGFPKCGTTSVEANLGYLAPIPEADVCTPAPQTVYYSYKNWPKQYSRPGYEQLFRGTKCPAFIQGTWLSEWTKHLPRTKLIVGIRHPVLWFQSFWNMQLANHLTKFAGDDPYNIMKPCQNKGGRGCRNGCPHSQLLCMHRGRFHLSLAALGKTELSPEELSILAANDMDGGVNMKNLHVTNDVFLYEIHQLKEEYLWEDMARYIGAESIRHDKRVNSHGKNRSMEYDFCEDRFDKFRAAMMPISFEVGTWLQKYFIPLAKNKSRTDVVIPNADKFFELVEKYKYDPCKKLKRLDNGTFVL